jgi:hypothetical protein
LPSRIRRAQHRPGLLAVQRSAGLAAAAAAAVAAELLLLLRCRFAWTSHPLHQQQVMQLRQENHGKAGREGQQGAGKRAACAPALQCMVSGGAWWQPGARGG